MIDEFIKQGKSMVCYRRPQDDTAHVLTQEGEPQTVADVGCLNGIKAFVFAPFNPSIEHPVIILQPDNTQAFKLTDLHINLPNYRYEEEEPSETYSRHFNAFTKELGKGSLKKLVLSRSKQVPRSSDFSVQSAFIAACKRYTHSYVYLFHTKQSGTWLGCTPEMLLCGSHHQWQTVALAGTQLMHNEELPTDWDEKNKSEQRWVATYIKEQLNNLGIAYTESSPYTVPAGKLAHIKSDFHFRLTDSNHLGDVLKMLHPTPAVCGLPKEAAKKFILNTEQNDREYYSGFLGWLHPDGVTELYVNLRCMKIKDTHFTLYAGGGILPESNLFEEWKETENKLQTMFALTQIKPDVFE